MSALTLRKTPNARIWVWVNDGPVKLTLRPNRPLSWYQSAPDEEGWRGQGCTWELAAFAHHQELVATWITEGRDCDGYVSHSYDLSAHADPRTYRALAEFSPYGRDPCKGIRWPQWTETRSEVYDAYARAAGY